MSRFRRQFCVASLYFPPNSWAQIFLVHEQNSHFKIIFLQLFYKQFLMHSHHFEDLKEQDVADPNLHHAPEYLASYNDWRNESDQLEKNKKLTLANQSIKYATQGSCVWLTLNHPVCSKNNNPDLHKQFSRIASATHDYNTSLTTREMTDRRITAAEAEHIEPYTYTNSCSPEPEFFEAKWGDTVQFCGKCKRLHRMRGWRSYCKRILGCFSWYRSRETELRHASSSDRARYQYYWITTILDQIGLISACLLFVVFAVAAIYGYLALVGVFGHEEIVVIPTSPQTGYTFWGPQKVIQDQGHVGSKVPAPRTRKWWGSEF